MVLSRRLLPVVAVLIWDSRTLGQARDADSVLAATREALGGDKNLAASGLQTSVENGANPKAESEGRPTSEFRRSYEAFAGFLHLFDN